jgi:triosephosphate isomerase (TIM)
MRKKLIVGNWKMNGRLADNAQLLADVSDGIGALSDVELAVCAPYPYLAQVSTLLNPVHVSWGAQDVSRYADGAYTGDVSAEMLCDFGCRFVIIGHSERRSCFGESDAIVVEKYKRVVATGISPIVCVGETIHERESGLANAVILRQMVAVLDAASVNELSRTVFAYEPVWAIGTGRTATPAQAQEMHVFIRQQLARVDADLAQRIRVLYGGSMKPSNATELLAQSDIDGGLIGGASLLAKDFLAIAAAVNS